MYDSVSVYQLKNVPFFYLLVYIITCNVANFLHKKWTVNFSHHFYVFPAFWKKFAFILTPTENVVRTTHSSVFLLLKFFKGQNIILFSLVRKIYKVFTLLDYYSADDLWDKPAFIPAHSSSWYLPYITVLSLMQTTPLSEMCWIAQYYFNDWISSCVSIHILEYESLPPCREKGRTLLRRVFF